MDIKDMLTISKLLETSHGMEMKTQWALKAYQITSNGLILTMPEDVGKYKTKVMHVQECLETVQHCWEKIVGTMQIH